jgi:hypothetical protein
MKSGFEKELVTERDRLNRLIDRVKAGETWVGETLGRDTAPAFIVQIRAAIDQLEVALRGSLDAKRHEGEGAN